MNQKIMSIFTRTPLHVGAGNSVGAIDSPIMRERHTRIPIIPGSSLKGVLADLWMEDLEKNHKGDLVRKKNSESEMLFGQQKDEKRDTKDSAGQLLIGEARVLAFPVRSAKGAFAWITAPMALQKFQAATGMKLEIPPVSIDAEHCFGSESLLLVEKVVLEEYCLVSQGLCSELAEQLAQLSENVLWKTIKDRLVVVSDEMFSYFVEHACEVVTRIRVNDEKGTVDNGALFNQEQVPSETMFYGVIGANDKDNEDAIGKLESRLVSAGNILQIGGDETIGLGYCEVNLN